MNKFSNSPLCPVSGVKRYSEAVRRPFARVLFTLLFLLVLLSSCKSTDNITYFQDANHWADTLSENQTYAKIRPSDELRIIVSAENQASVAAFNKPFHSDRQSGQTQVNVQGQLQTYVVDSKGNIDFPTLGTLHVEGMTTEELTDYLKNEIKQYVQNPIVTIDPLGIGVLVMGEVNNPGRVFLQENRTSIIDALASAQDLTIYGNRQSVLIIHRDGGKQVKHIVDLTSIKSLEDPQCILHQDDIVYVSPNDARRASSRYNSMKQQNLSMISTIVSVVSVLASLTIAIAK